MNTPLEYLKSSRLPPRVPACMDRCTTGLGLGRLINYKENGEWNIENEGGGRQTLH